MSVCLKVLVEDEEAAVSLVEGKHLSDDVQLKPPKKESSTALWICVFFAHQIQEKNFALGESYNGSKK